VTGSHEPRTPRPALPHPWALVPGRTSRPGVPLKATSWAARRVLGCPEVTSRGRAGVRPGPWSRQRRTQRPRSPGIAPPVRQRPATGSHEPRTPRPWALVRGRARVQGVHVARPPEGDQLGSQTSPREPGGDIPGCANAHPPRREPTAVGLYARGRVSRGASPEGRPDASELPEDRPPGATRPALRAPVAQPGGDQLGAPEILQSTGGDPSGPLRRRARQPSPSRERIALSVRSGSPPARPTPGAGSTSRHLPRARTASGLTLRAHMVPTGVPQPVHPTPRGPRGASVCGPADAGLGPSRLKGTNWAGRRRARAGGDQGAGTAPAAAQGRPPPSWPRHASRGDRRSVRDAWPGDASVRSPPSRSSLRRCRRAGRPAARPAVPSTAARTHPRASRANPRDAAGTSRGPATTRVGGQTTPAQTMIDRRRVSRETPRPGR
jgi:hypothetical protein